MLLVYEDGPFNILRYLRYALGVSIGVYDVNSELIGYESNGTLFARLISCHRCTGFWVGLIIGLVNGLDVWGILAIIAIGIFLNEKS